MYQGYHHGLVAVAKCLNIDISYHTKKWASIYNHRCKHRGKADAIKFCKELNTVAERYALGQQIEPLSWAKSDKDGYPKIINFAKQNLRSKDQLTVMFTLSVFRTVELCRLPISKDISTVTAPCNADTELVESIIAFIPTWLKRFPPLKLSKMKYHFTLKNGPNGHALKTSDMDVSAVMNDPEIYGAIHRVQDHRQDGSPMKDVTTLHSGAIHSRLTQFPEKSGKTRTIAVIDYYSQRCLKPLHDGLMTFLRNLVSDGTFSHQNVGKYAEQATKDKSFIACTDLTAATDRFPASIQKALLDEMIKDPDLSNPMWTLLAERTFRVAWSGEEVTYNCGQPMGAYGSWPLFSVAHHLIVEYCSHLVNEPNIKNKYRIIGDDNVITSERVYTAYHDVMTRLGLEINQGKTVISPKSADNSAAEVAKQLYLNGKCLTPLTPGFIRNIKKPHMFNTCMGVLIDRYEINRPEFPSALIETLYRKGKDHRLVWLLGSNPINGNIKPSDEGYDINCPWEAGKTAEYRKKYHKMFISKLIDQAHEYCDKSLNQVLGNQDPLENLDDFDPLNFDWDSIKDIHAWGSPQKSSASPDPQCYAEIRISIERQLTKAIKELSSVSTGEDPEALAARFDFVPDPDLPYLDRKEIRAKRTATLLESLLDYNDSWEFVQLEW